LTLRPEVNFTNMFTRSFYVCRSQKHKMTNDFTVIFTLLESTCVKAVHKTLMKLTPEAEGLLIFTTKTLVVKKKL